MSPGASHAATAMQVPPLQLVEQQSVPSVQASPSVLQVEPVGPGGSATHFEPEPQMPEQHCASVAQDWSTWRQTDEEQVAPGLPAFVQVWEQHCASEPQGSPGQLHMPASPWHCCVEGLHTAEQHCESRLHATFAPRHVGW